MRLALQPEVGRKLGAAEALHRIVHAPAAAARGIADGALVRAFNDRGSYLCRAEVSARARPGLVVGLGVWWRKMGPGGTNVNELTSQALTDLGRAPTFYDCAVEVERAST